MRTPIKIKINLPACNCFSTSALYANVRLVLHLMAFKFYWLVWLLEMSPALNLLIYSVIISSDLYGCAKAQRINPSASLCVTGQLVLFLLWMPEYFVLLQRLDWAPRPINIHDSCIAHKHAHTHTSCDGVSGTDLTLSLTGEWLHWWTGAI